MSEDSIDNEHDDPVQVLRALERLNAAERYSEVVSLTEDLVRKHPNFFGFHLARGLAIMNLRDYEAAISCFRRVQELKLGESQSLEAMAWCIRKVNRIDETLPYFAELFYSKPVHATASPLLQMAFEATELDWELIEQLLRAFHPAYFSAHPDSVVEMSPFIPFDEWCASNNASIETFDPGGEFRFAQADGQPISPYFAPPLRFATVPNATILAGADWVIAPTGEFLDGSGLNLLRQQLRPRFGLSYLPFAPNPRRNRILYARSRHEIAIDEDVLFLSAERRHHFGHWIFDYLPRLIAWRRAGKPPLKLLTSASLPAAHRETLQRFGVRPSDLIEVPDDGQIYRFRSATALLPGDSARPTPTMAKFLFDALALQKTPLPPGTAGRRFFLERSQTTRGRDIANRTELQSVLDAFAFETVRRPELSVVEQDEKFSQAEIILVPFGSDTVTIFQVRPETNVIVLNFENMEQIYPGIEPIPARYCAILNMRYHTVSCGLKERVGKMSYHGDMVVDCDALRAAIDSIISRRIGAPSKVNGRD